MEENSCNFLIVVINNNIACVYNFMYTYSLPVHIWGDESN